MKPLFALLLLAFFASPLTAQTTFDYMLFRPGVQYLYDNPETNPIERYERKGSEILGMKIDENNLNFRRQYRLYQMPEMNDAESCYTIRPSFAGTGITVDHQITTMYFGEEANARRLIIVHSAPTDSIWQAAPEIIGRVDSITTGNFLGWATTVKHLSFLDPESDELLATIQISKDLGLLTPVDFYHLGRENLWSSTLISTSEPILGPQLPTTDEIFDAPPGTKLSTYKTTRLGGSNPSYEHSFRNMMVDTIVWDAVSQMSIMVLTYNELSYRITPAAGDSIYNLNTYFNRQTTISTNHITISEIATQPGSTIANGRTTFNRRMSIACAGWGDQRCFGIGRGIQFIATTTSPQVPECLPALSTYNGVELYFRNAAGPYGMLGELVTHTTELHQVQSTTSNCGEPLDLTVSTRQFLPDERIRLYPNPASHQITVEIPDDLGAASVQVFDLRGRLQLTANPGRGNRQLNLSDLPAGVYIVAVRGASGLVGRRRLVVR